MLGLAPKEVARDIGVTTKTLENWRKVKGKGPRYIQNGKGGRIGYILESVKAWKERNTKG